MTKKIGMTTNNVAKTIHKYISVQNRRLLRYARNDKLSIGATLPSLRGAVSSEAISFFEAIKSNGSNTLFWNKYDKYLRYSMILKQGYLYCLIL